MRVLRAASSTAACAALSLLAGCGGNGSLRSIPTSPPSSAIVLKGQVKGGQQPIGGSQVKLFASGTSGYGAGAKVLLTGDTDESGYFSLSGSYTCPSTNPLAYLLATGGDPGTGKNNAAIALMVPLGPCNQLGSVSTIVVNEVSTIVSAWTMGPFLAAGGEMGTSSGNAQGLLNALANAGNLMNFSTGATPGSSAPANAVLPAAKINTLADILAACVNSTGTATCDSLFLASTPSGGAAPDNTLDAARNIAAHPSSNVGTLYDMAAPAAPFQPTLVSPPADWTLAVTFSGGGLDLPGSLAIDASGNVWAANYFNSLSELSPAGQPLSPAAGFKGGGLEESYGIAVNQDGSVWVTNETSPAGVNKGHGAITVFSSSGSVISGSGGYFNGGVFFPVAVAADTDGSMWSANYGNSTASRLTSSGASLSGSSGFGASGLAGPVGVAIDAAHNAWLVNQSASPGTVTSISADGGTIRTISCCGDSPSGIATDAVGVSAGASDGHVWSANNQSSTVSEIRLNVDGSATVVSTGYSGGGLNHPNAIAVDGAGNVWVTNFDGESITQLEGAAGSNPGHALSSAIGYGSDLHLSKPYGIAVDSSGNVWVSNQGANTITQFVGAATPVRTPLLGPAQLP